nr:divalent-cation tolerance protein CutA [Kibdelosporangium sp. MJ126-NF4]
MDAGYRKAWEAGVSESYCAVITTTDSSEEAEHLARGIVEARLAACVNIIAPIRSFYWWKGKIEDAQEWQCWAKTNADRVDALMEYIKANHSYEVPEIVVVPIADGSPDYLTWLTTETRPTS